MSEFNCKKKNFSLFEFMQLIGHREFGIELKPFVYPISDKNWYIGFE